MTHFRKLLLKNVVVYLAVALILIVFLLFIQGDINNKATKIIQQRQVLFLKLQSLDSLVALRLQSQEVQPYNSLLDNILPSSDYATDFSKDLASFAKKDKLGFGFVFGDQTPSTAESPGWINFRSALQGSMDNFDDFLKNIEDSRYFVNLSSLDLTKKNGDFEIVVNGKVFLR
ncbi:MAG: hypothetical protein Athens071426_425 [Parcubacteria group bacterium Athens0714_26]|nr:MAG: hypothetical protein Athens101426_626 [Parcubacteria group bacterium Athens1014_26]TSD02664.1 MAG: hypothetical protein Athens071426_425 [Parcubacteria group bacterium Athens0714_26]